MINIKKQDKMIKALEPKLSDGIFLAISFVMCALGYDLGLEFFCNANGYLVIYFGVWYLGWVIFTMIIACIRKKYIKRGWYVPTDEVFFKNQR